MIPNSKRKNPPCPTARALCERELLGDFSALVPTTATHFHARCCTDWYMNYSVDSLFRLINVDGEAGRAEWAISVSGNGRYALATARRTW